MKDYAQSNSFNFPESPSIPHRKLATLKSPQERGGALKGTLVAVLKVKRRPLGRVQACETASVRSRQALGMAVELSYPPCNTASSAPNLLTLPTAPVSLSLKDNGSGCRKLSSPPRDPGIMCHLITDMREDVSLYRKGYSSQLM